MFWVFWKLCLLLLQNIYGLYIYIYIYIYIHTYTRHVCFLSDYILHFSKTLLQFIWETKQECIQRAKTIVSRQFHDFDRGINLVIYREQPDFIQRVNMIAYGDLK